MANDRVSPGVVSSYPLHNVDNYIQIRSRTALYGSSFLPSAIHKWNKLPIDHRNGESQDTFKGLLTETNNKVPYYYNCENHIYIAALYRM